MAKLKPQSTQQTSPKKKDNSPSTNTSDELVAVLDQDVRHLERVVADLNAQNARLQRMVYDKPPEEPEPVSDLLERNAAALESFNRATSKRHQPDVFLALRAEKEQQTRKHLLRYRGYGSYKQKKTKVCPCGDHQGIEFLKDGERIDHLCPKHWWVIQTWVAMDDKKIGAFVDSTPLEWYLGKYKLEA